jgi:hypothetical protein
MATHKAPQAMLVDSSMTILQEERTVYFRDSHVYCRINNNFNQQAGLVSLRVQLVPRRPKLIVAYPSPLY